MNLAMRPDLTRIATKDAPAPAGPYVQGISLQGALPLTFVSGQLPLDPVTGELVEGDVVDQLRAALTNALGIVAAAGGTLNDVVKVTIFTTQLSQAKAINGAYEALFGLSLPTRTMVGVDGLPQGALVEVDVIAACAQPTLPAAEATNDE
ncbi:MAG TPA: Rid family detoxifying hydrolase [Candidatus Acidoferrum sp.]|jgi:2-iminobutanoate/2-iminopropanoate deaminase|nr:Rid family detoxifying hydrolase [Candidatus Acidoferrum sp.]